MGGPDPLATGLAGSGPLSRLEPALPFKEFGKAMAEAVEGIRLLGINLAKYQAAIMEKAIRDMPKITTGTTTWDPPDWYECRHCGEGIVVHQVGWVHATTAAAFCASGVTNAEPVILTEKEWREASRITPPHHLIKDNLGRLIGRNGDVVRVPTDTWAGVSLDDDDPALTCTCSDPEISLSEDCPIHWQDALNASEMPSPVSWKPLSVRELIDKGHVADLDHTPFGPPGPGCEVYSHPQGGVILVNRDDHIMAFDKNGKNKHTSATVEKLRSPKGHGQWKRRTDLEA